MSNKSLSRIAFVMLLATLALPAFSDCENPQTQAEMNGCAYERFKRADADLNREWKNLKTRLRALEADLGFEGWFDKALEGQRGWIAYRDGQCAAQGYENHGGSIEPLMVISCKTRMTRARIKEIQELDDSGGLSAGHTAAGQWMIESLEFVHSNGTLYRFPQIGGDTPAAARINTYLQTQVLDQIPGHQRGELLGRVWPMESSTSGLVSLDYTLAFDFPGILNVEILREYEGAGFSNFVEQYHFDASTGHLLTLRHLLTPDAFAKFDANIRDMRLARIDAFLAGEEIGGARLRSDANEAAEQRELYRECRSWIEQEHPTIGDALRISRSAFELVRTPCAAQAFRALLDLDLSTKLSFDPESEILSDYGQCLLIDRRARCPRVEGGFTAGVFLGKMSDGPNLTLVVEGVNWEGIPTGWYFYDPQGEKIKFDASLADDGSLVLRDMDSPQATIRLRSASNGGWTGSWNKEGQDLKELSLR